MAFLFRRLVKPAVSVSRSFHSTGISNEKLTGMDKIDFDLTIYRKYGLLRDDTLSDSDPDVLEALDRIPEDMLFQRIYRCVRAQQLYLEHNVLPKDQWTKIDDDHTYLTPYLEEVRAERRERDEWNRNH